MKNGKNWIHRIFMTFSVILSILALCNNISLAAVDENDSKNEKSFFQEFVTELNQASDPYQYIYLYDQKDKLYYEMDEKEWNSYMTILKYLSLEHIGKMTVEFRTEGEIEEVLTLYIGAKKCLLENNYKFNNNQDNFTILSDYVKSHSYSVEGVNKVVTDFDTYKEYLGTILPLDINQCLELWADIDLSQNEEELKKASEKLNGYIKTIARPNKKLSKEEIREIFELEHIPIEDIDLNEEDVSSRIKKSPYNLQAVSDTVFAYSMRGSIAKITVAEYYKKGGYKIHDEWTEGYFVTGKEGVVLGNEEPIFCANPKKNFHKGYYAKKPYPSDNEIVKIIAASLYKQKQTPEYSWLSKDYQYVAQQCVIWNIENQNNKWIKPDLSDSRLRLEFGNGVHFPSPHQNIYISDKVFKLVDECILWGKQNFNCFPDARADYYVKSDIDQPIVRFYGTYIPTGFVSLKKSSANLNVTNKNLCYSLKGAEYGIYSDQNCTHKTGMLITDETGNSNKVKLEVGNYWVKEIKAPKGYALDRNVYQITISANQTYELKITDIPSMSPVDILIEKIDKETSKNIAQGHASLENAHFRIKFYGGIWNKDVDPEELGKTPVRTWIFKTDKNGIVRYDNASKISGDPLYTNLNGKFMLPAGTLTIQEIKAPEGYLINPKIHAIQIICNDDGQETMHVYKKTHIEDEVLKLKIVKMLKGTSKAIENVKFTHTRPNGTKETVTTNTKGEASLTGLEYGRHTLIETYAPEGFVRNSGKITFTVTDNNKIIVDDNTSTESNGKITLTVKPDGNAVLDVEDIYTDYSLHIHKKNQDNKVLAGAEFTLYADQGCTQIIKKEKTDDKGEVNFTNLKVTAVYYLKETKAPKGYQTPINKEGKENVYMINTVINPSTGSLEYYINGERQRTDKLSGTLNNPILNLTVINYSGVKLPETGTSTRFLMFVISIGCLICWVYHHKSYKIKTK